MRARLTAAAQAEHVHAEGAEPLGDDPAKTSEAKNGRCDIPAYHFKRRFGFDPEPARYRYRVAKGSELPRISPDNSRYRLAIGLWRKLPLRVATARGPRLVGHFG